MSLCIIFSHSACALNDALGKYGLTTPENREKIISFSRDGCSTNSAALNLLQAFGFHKSIDLKCISHASSNVGKRLYDNCRLGVSFVGTFNNMLNTSNTARLRFRQLIQKEVKRYNNDIRWFYQQETSSQIFKFWPQVLQLIYDDADFASAVRLTLRSMVEADENIIRLELALLEDAAIHSAKLCYKQEGDGFKIPTTYDHRHFVLFLLIEYIEHQKCLTYVHNKALTIFTHDPVQRKDVI